MTRESVKKPPQQEESLPPGSVEERTNEAPMIRGEELAREPEPGSAPDLTSSETCVPDDEDDDDTETHVKAVSVEAQSVSAASVPSGEEAANASMFPLEISGEVHTSSAPEDAPIAAASPILSDSFARTFPLEITGEVRVSSEDAINATRVTIPSHTAEDESVVEYNAYNAPAEDESVVEYNAPEVYAEANEQPEFIPLLDDAATVPTGIIEHAPAVPVETATTAQATERRHLVKSAALVSIGNLGSSLLGMVRQMVVTAQGVPVATPFNAALAPVNNFYQLLVNGSTDGALIPVFNDYAAPEKRHEMRRVVFTVVNLILIISLITSLGYLLISPWFVNALVSGYPGADKALTLQYSQIIFFSLVVLGPFAVLLAALFSLKTFGWPAFATASYHAGIILGALVFALVGNHVWGPIMLPIGLLIGAAGQIVLLLPGIRSRKLYYMFVLDLKHPALKRIYRLYWPIAISYVFSMALVFLDLHLQSLTPQSGAATTAMATATTLIQFPIGLVAQALSVAVLPTLAEHAREGNTERFKEALLLGIRLGLLLMIPAMTGLLVLRTPIVYVIFAHRNYSLQNADLSALALQNYAYQLPFVALDQLLIAAFYARKNTKTPVIIGVVSMLFYLAVALPFYRTIGMAALAFANTVQNSSHAIILLILLRMSIGSLHIRRTIPAILKICAATVAMGLVAWGAMVLLGHVPLFSLTHLFGQILTLLIAGGLAVAVYIGGILLLKVEEINLVKRAVMAKLGRKS